MEEGLDDKKKDKLAILFKIFYEEITANLDQLTDYLHKINELINNPDYNELINTPGYGRQLDESVAAAKKIIDDMVKVARAAHTDDAENFPESSIFTYIYKFLEES